MLLPGWMVWYPVSTRHQWVSQQPLSKWCPLCQQPVGIVSVLLFAALDGGIVWDGYLRVSSYAATLQEWRGVHRTGKKYFSRLTGSPTETALTIYKFANRLTESNMWPALQKRYIHVSRCMLLRILGRSMWRGWQNLQTSNFWEREFLTSWIPIFSFCITRNVDFNQ